MAIATSRAAPRPRQPSVRGALLNNAYTIAALTNATSAERPYTPITLATCATARTVTWLLPSGTHGKPPKRIRADTQSRPTRRRKEERRPARTCNQAGEHHGRDRRVDRQICSEQQHRHDRQDHGHPAEHGQHAAGPIDRACEVHQSGHQPNQNARRGGCPGTVPAARASRSGQPAAEQARPRRRPDDRNAGN